jgi:hypothetical protein
MKRSKSIMFAAAGLVALGAVALPLNSATASPKRARYVLTENGTEFHFIDASAPAEDGQAGDTITFESTLSKKGKQVGTLEGHCIQIRGAGTLDDCEVTVTIGTNSFRMAGPFDPVTGGTLTVLGGTGGWVGVGGTDSIVNQPDGSSIHTIDLVKL